MYYTYISIINTFNVVLKSTYTEWFIMISDLKNNKNLYN